VTGGDALDEDLESEFKSHFEEYAIDRHEEEKQPNISKTRIGEIDKSSIMINSNFDQTSLEDEQAFGDLVKHDTRNQMKFSTQQKTHNRENSFKEIAGIENRMGNTPYLDSQDS
jgi:hypothetical protein